MKNLSKEIDEIKNQRETSELKNTITEIETSVGELNSRVEGTEKQIKLEK